MARIPVGAGGAAPPFLLQRAIPSDPQLDCADPKKMSVAHHASADQSQHRSGRRV